MPILALGVSYRRAGIDLLERLAPPEDELAKAYHHLQSLPAVREGVILSTCNRVEAYADVTGYHEGFQDLKRFLSEARDVPFEEIAEPLYSHYEEQAAAHLFGVAAGLDSMVVGEPQILTQVRAALRRAEAEGAAGPAMRALFHHAVRAGRRARTETAVGASPAAFVEAGTRLAERHLGGVVGRSVLVVGAGEMSGLAATSLRERGVGAMRVLNRTPERARTLAARVGGEAGSLDELADALAGVDVVVSCTAAPAVVIHAGAVSAAMSGRDRRLFLLDLAVPRDVDPAAAGVDGVALVGIEELRDEVVGTTGNEDLRAASDIVQEEARRYSADRRIATLAPLIAALHARGEEVRDAELRRVASRLAGLSEREREAVDALTRAIVRKLLHSPVATLKERAGRGAGARDARTLAELFGLEPPDEE